MQHDARQSIINAVFTRANAAKFMLQKVVTLPFLLRCSKT
jgi:hypothetical protein